MEFNLTTQKKIKALNDTKNALHSEMYTVLIVLGHDPDAFDMNSWEPEEIVASGEDHRLRRLVQSLRLIELKLAELQ
jgi:hypothetical protein